MTEKVSFTVAEAAAATGLSEATIRRAYRSGALAVHYPTSKPVIRRLDLEAWIEAAPTEKASA